MSLPSAHRQDSLPRFMRQASRKLSSARKGNNDNNSKIQPDESGLTQKVWNLFHQIILKSLLIPPLSVERFTNVWTHHESKMSFTFPCFFLGINQLSLKSKLWSSGEGQARICKGWQSRQKASKLKPLPRAYTKVGCHPPPPPPTTTTTHHPEVSIHLTNGLMVARWGWWR